MKFIFRALWNFIRPQPYFRTSPPPTFISVTTTPDKPLVLVFDHEAYTQCWVPKTEAFSQTLRYEIVRQEGGDPSFHIETSDCGETAIWVQDD